MTKLERVRSDDVINVESTKKSPIFMMSRSKQELGKYVGIVSRKLL